MNIIEIEREIFERLGFDFDVALAAYTQAKEGHKLTIGVSAPVAHHLVEHVYNNGGRYIIVDETPAQKIDPKLEKIRQINAESQARIKGFLTDEDDGEALVWDALAIIQKGRKNLQLTARESVIETRLEALIPARESIRKAAEDAIVSVKAAKTKEEVDAVVPAWP